MIKKHQYNPSEKTNLIKWGIVTPKKKNIFKNMNHVMNMGIIMLMEIVVLPWETLCQTSGHALYVLVVSLNLNRLKQNNSCSKKLGKYRKWEGKVISISLLCLKRSQILQIYSIYPLLSATPVFTKVEHRNVVNPPVKRQTVIIIQCLFEKNRQKKKKNPSLIEFKRSPKKQIMLLKKIEVL